MPARIAWTLVGLALAAAAVLAQQAPATPVADAPPVTFRAEVNFVEVDAVVVDAAGNPVEGLTADDFEILEDGEPQTIDAFTHVSLPIERREQPLFAAAPIEPDVQSNAQAEGRVYVFVLDDYHVAFAQALRVKDTLREFIEERMGANDVGAVVMLGGRPGDGQDFTNNRNLLLAAVERFTGKKPASPTSMMTREFNRPAVQALLENGSSDFVQDPDEFERSFRARQAMDAIRRLSEFMENVRGRRKTLILFSEGILFNVYDPFSASSAAVLDESRDAVAAATRANVTIYALDPRGLFSAGELAETANSPAADSGRISDESPQLNIGLQSLTAEFRLSQQSLMTLAERTGGFAAVNRNVLSEVFDQIVRENSAYYVLGYYSTNPRRDGGYRRIDVRVRRPGLEVRARDGYVAPRGRAPELDATPEAPRQAALRDALASPLDVTGLPLTVFAAAYKGVAPNAMVPVVVELDPDSLSFEERDGTFNDRVTVTLLVTEGDGDTLASNQHELNLALRPETLAAARANGLRVVSELALPPGRHRVRVAVAEETGRAGSVSYDLDVPDFARDAFALSGVTVTSREAFAALTVLAQSPLASVLAGPPSASRTFTRGDVLSLYAEVYENAPGAPAHALDLTTTVRTGDGRVVFESREERSSAELAGASGGYGYGPEVPLDLAPGLYVVRVEARSRLGGASASRDILIRVTAD